MSKELKKVLILAYFFKPNSLTASNRPLFWIKYLHKFGYYPVVVTRTWGDGVISNPKDVFTKGKKEENLIETFDHYEVHYVSYKANIRDQWFSQGKSTIFVKVLTLIALFTKGFTNYFNEGKEIYSYSRRLLEKKSIDKMLITANPFVMFKYGYLLSREFGIKWIADYRDDWTTSELNDNTGFLFGLVKKVDQVLEKKWVKTANLVTSVSSYYTSKISDFVGVPGEVLLNGFEAYQLGDVKPDSEYFSLCFNGTLYQTQQVETLIDGIKLFIGENPSLALKMNFPGLAFSVEQDARVKDLITGYEKYFWISDRIKKEEVIKIQQQSHLLVMINHQGLKGIPSSKLYEYLSLKRHVLVVNGDNDIVDDTVRKANVGKVANSASEVADVLKEYWTLFQADIDNAVISHNLSSIFKIEKSVESLSEKLDRLT